MLYFKLQLNSFFVINAQVIKLKFYFGLHPQVFSFPRWIPVDLRCCYRHANSCVHFEWKEQAHRMRGKMMVLGRERVKQVGGEEWGGQFI